MKLELFKKLIKEAVREVLQEELKGMLAEVVKPQQNIPVRKPVIFQEHKKITSTESPKVGVNPLMDILNETRQSMTRDEYQQLVSHIPGESNPGIGNLLEHNTRQEPGIDISTLDFVKKAGEVYKASIQKDKERLGG